MELFTVNWRIQVHADNHREAAKKALEIQRDADSIATVFGVRDSSEQDFRQIDLGEEHD